MKDFEKEPLAQPYFLRGDLYDLFSDFEQEENEVKEIIDCLGKHLNEIERELIPFELNKYQTRFLCNITTRIIDKILKRSGFKSSVLEGDVILDEHESVEHRINFVRTEKKIIFIDFTANQFKWFQNQKIVIKIMENNNPETIHKMLKKEFHFWLPSSD